MHVIILIKLRRQDAHQLHLVRLLKCPVQQVIERSAEDTYCGHKYGRCYEQRCRGVYIHGPGIFTEQHTQTQRCKDKYVTHPFGEKQAGLGFDERRITLLQHGTVAPIQVEIDAAIGNL